MPSLLARLSLFVVTASGFDISFVTVDSLPSAQTRPPFASLVYTLDSTLPRFGWQLVGSVAAQATFHIVATQAGSVAWDSGVVSSNATSQIVWNGADLLSDADYEFTIAVTTTDGNAARTSQLLFSTGLLTPSDWRGAQWIGGGGALRGSLAIPAGAVVSRAVLHVSAVGFYELFVNNVRVRSMPDGRETRLNPGFSTVFSARTLYNSWDLSPLLVPGGDDNIIGLRIAAGKYGYLGEFCTGGPLECNAAVASLEVSYAGNMTATPFVTSAAWLAGPSTHTESLFSYNLYNGEKIDARAAPSNWASPSFVPDAAWTPAAVRPPPTRTLSAHAFPPIAPWAAPRTAMNVTPVGDDFVFSFDVNGAYMCALTLPAGLAAGSVVTIVFAEQFFAGAGVTVGFRCPSACCADGGNCANQTFSYTAGGAGADIFEMTFANAAFKFAQVSGWPVAAAGPPPVEALVCEPTSTGAAAAGTVYFNDTVLDGIQGMIVRSQRANFHSIPTDCAHREKRGWMADAGVSVAEALLNIALAPAYENWLRTHADTLDTGCSAILPLNWTCPKWNPNQPGGADLTSVAVEADGDAYPNCYLCCSARPGFGCTPGTPLDASGAISDVIPFDKNGYGSFPGSITWTSTSFIVAHELLARTGNAVFFAGRIVSFLEAHLGFYTRTADGKGLISYDQYGDWNAIDTSTSKLFMANAMYVCDALYLAETASATGDHAGAQAYVLLASLVNAAVTARWWNSTCGCWDSGSQTAQAMALSYGLGNSSTSARTAAEQLAADVLARGTHPSGGCPGTRFVLQALTSTGRGDVALALARQTAAPSWGAMLVGIPGFPSLGTLWEGWHGYGAKGPGEIGGSSGLHIMLGGGIGEWLYSHALGLLFQYEQRAQPPSDRDAACAATLGLRNLLRTHAAVMSGGGACAIAAAFATVRSALERGEAVRALFSSRALRQTLTTAANPATSVKSSHIPLLEPVASLVLDAAIVRALKSSKGWLETPSGRLSASWALSAAGELHVTLSVPHAVSASVLVPRDLLSLCGAALPQISAAIMGEGERTIMPEHAEWVSEGTVGNASTASESSDALRVRLPMHGSWEIVFHAC